MNLLHENNNGVDFLDYVRNYTFAVISGVGSLSCFTYGFIKDKPSFLIAGLGALGMTSLRAFNGYINLKKMQGLCEENKALKKRLEKILE